MKRKINVFEHASEIMQNLSHGILLSAKAGDRQNAMTVSWGTLGIDWGKPVFTVFVRDSRYTKGMLDANPVFTMSLPVGDYDKKIIALCGSKSGRDTDKLALAGLTPEPAEVNGVGGYKELPLTLECRIVYQQKQDARAISEANTERWYPRGIHPDGDYHTAYVGEIVAAYVIE